MGFSGWNTYYDYVEGDWYFIALDSICARTDGCKEDQLAWLQERLQANSDYACTLAYYHEPRFSSGTHGSNTHMTEIWNTLYSGGVDLVLSGHDHVYERFKPMDINGAYESIGIREFVVGTGGAQLRSFTSNIHPSSEKRIAEKNGVLWLGLRSTSFDFEFRQTDGTVTDSGSNITCYD